MTMSQRHASLTVDWINTHQLVGKPFTVTLRLPTKREVADSAIDENVLAKFNLPLIVLSYYEDELIFEGAVQKELKFLTQLEKDNRSRSQPHQKPTTLSNTQHILSAETTDQGSSLPSHRKLVEVKGEPLFAVDGLSGEVSLMFTDSSANHNNRKFVLLFVVIASCGSPSSLQPSIRYYAVSNSIKPVRYTLQLFENPGSDYSQEEAESNGYYVWFKDVGGKDKGIDLDVSLVDARKHIVRNIPVPLKLTLMYCSPSVIKSCRSGSGDGSSAGKANDSVHSDMYDATQVLAETLSHKVSGSPSCRGIKRTNNALQVQEATAADASAMRVPHQQILQLAPDSVLTINPDTGRTRIRFRINEVSSHHRGHLFQVHVAAAEFHALKKKRTRLDATFISGAVVAAGADSDGTFAANYAADADADADTDTGAVDRSGSSIAAIRPTVQPDTLKPFVRSAAVASNGLQAFSEADTLKPVVRSAAVASNGLQAFSEAETDRQTAAAAAALLSASMTNTSNDATAVPTTVDNNAQMWGTSQPQHEMSPIAPAATRGMISLDDIAPALSIPVLVKSKINSHRLKKQHHVNHSTILSTIVTAEPTEASSTATSISTATAASVIPAPLAIATLAAQQGGDAIPTSTSVSARTIYTGHPFQPHLAHLAHPSIASQLPASNLLGAASRRPYDQPASATTASASAAAVSDPISLPSQFDVHKGFHVLSAWAEAVRHSLQTIQWRPIGVLAGNINPGTNLPLFNTATATPTAAAEIAGAEAGSLRTGITNDNTIYSMQNPNRIVEELASSYDRDVVPVLRALAGYLMLHNDQARNPERNECHSTQN